MVHGRVSLRKTVNVFSWTFNRPWFGHRSKSKGEHVRGTLETAPDKRPWNEAQSIFLRTMRENAGLTKRTVRHAVGVDGNSGCQ